LPAHRGLGRGEGGKGAPGFLPRPCAFAPCVQELVTCRVLPPPPPRFPPRQVFKPSHILPTMTVEEAGEIEAREAMEREARQRRGEEKERARRVSRSAPAVRTALLPLDASCTRCCGQAKTLWRVGVSVPQRFRDCGPAPSHKGAH
jgi:hypothetical protein